MREPFLRLPSASAARELLRAGVYLSLLPWVHGARGRGDRTAACACPSLEWELTQAVQMVLHRSKVVTPQIEGFLPGIEPSAHAVLAPARFSAPATTAPERAGRPPGSSNFIGPFAGR